MSLVYDLICLENILFGHMLLIAIFYAFFYFDRCILYSSCHNHSHITPLSLILFPIFLSSPFPLCLSIFTCIITFIYISVLVLSFTSTTMKVIVILLIYHRLDLLTNQNEGCFAIYAKENIALSLFIGVWSHGAKIMTCMHHWSLVTHFLYSAMYRTASHICSHEKNVIATHDRQVSGDKASGCLFIITYFPFHPSYRKFAYNGLSCYLYSYKN